jgi:phosphoribosyl 1,2-cyclic phosphodiesterase
MLAAGPYPERLKERIRGGRGHLSNEQAAEMLRLLAGPELHTVVLAHLSAHNNTQELARAAAEAALSAAGRDEVRVLVALQDEPLEPIPV